jgi:hypothetical protein
MSSVAKLTVINAYQMSGNRYMLEICGITMIRVANEVCAYKLFSGSLDYNGEFSG